MSPALTGHSLSVSLLRVPDLAEQLKEAVSHIHGTITEIELEDSDLEEIDTSIPADPSIKNFSFANVDGAVYYRENSRMNRMELPAMTTERVLGMIELRDLTQELLQSQLEDASDDKIHSLQEKLNQTYDRFHRKIWPDQQQCQQAGIFPGQQLLPAFLIRNPG